MILAGTMIMFSGLLMTALSGYDLGVARAANSMRLAAAGRSSIPDHAGRPTIERPYLGSGPLAAAAVGVGLILAVVGVGGIILALPLGGTTRWVTLVGAGGFTLTVALLGVIGLVRRTTAAAYDKAQLPRPTQRPGEALPLSCRRARTRPARVVGSARVPAPAGGTGLTGAPVVDEDDSTIDLGAAPGAVTWGNLPGQRKAAMPSVDNQHIPADAQLGWVYQDASDAWYTVICAEDGVSRRLLRLTDFRVVSPGEVRLPLTLTGAAELTVWPLRSPTTPEDSTVAAG